MFQLASLIVVVLAVVGVVLAIGTRDRIRSIEFRLRLIERRLSASPPAAAVPEPPAVAAPPPQEPPAVSEPALVEPVPLLSPKIPPRQLEAAAQPPGAALPAPSWGPASAATRAFDLTGSDSRRTLWYPMGGVGGFHRGRHRRLFFSAFFH